MFRNGIIECVDTRRVNIQIDERAIIPSIAYKKDLVGLLPVLLTLQQDLDVDPPLVLMLTLTGVKGYRMGINHQFFDLDSGAPIDRDLLLIREVVLQDYEIDSGRTLRPIFAAVWNAAGWPGSRNYDESGNWKEHR